MMIIMMMIMVKMKTMIKKSNDYDNMIVFFVFTKSTVGNGNMD